MTRRTYKIDVQVIETRTITVEVEKTHGRDDLLEAYEKALAAYEAGDHGELHRRGYSTVSGSHNLLKEVEDPTIKFKPLAPSGTGYGWLITRDVLAEEDARDGDLHLDDVGAYGPSDVVLTREQVAEHGMDFRMFDDDGTLYYEGKFALAPDCHASGFEPLDDFGMPNAGCTEIHYKDTAGEWRRL
jgi:hypothetical protein